MNEISLKLQDMDIKTAANCLEALGSTTRLEIYRLLVQAGPQGAMVGSLQAKLQVPASTLSHHISRLVQVNLISQERESRSLICRANYQQMNELLAYLSEKCCHGMDDAQMDDNQSGAA